jgi:hypothetical protein
MKRFPLLVCLVLLLVMAGIPLVVAESIPTDMSPEVVSVSPQTGPNNGVVTITLYGSKLNQGSSVMLSSCTTGDIIHGTDIIASGTSLTASFSFHGERPTQYNVMVNSPFTDPFGNYHADNPGGRSKAFSTYQSSVTPTTATTATGTTTVTTTAPPSSGKNSIFMETNPNGATIYVDGKEVGTSSFSYYTDNDGVFNVVAKKAGYEDFAGQVTVVEGGPRARFYGLLVPLSSTDGTVTTTTSSTYSSSLPVSAATTIRKSTLKIPTVLGTFATPTEETPGDPAIVLWAAGIGMIFVVIRRR